MVAAVAAVRAMGQALSASVGRVIVGKAEVVSLLLVALLSEGHTLIEDVPGMGKTLMARALARTLGLTFARIQGTPDLLPGDVTGISYFNQKVGEFAFRAGPIFANIVLADEINRATPRTQSALLEAMQERQVTNEGQSLPLPRPFMLVATQNPVELEGTFPLPEAQLDRFLLRVRINYPTNDEERAMLYRFQESQPLDEIQPVIAAAEMERALPVIRAVHVSQPVADYLLAIVRATRQHAAVDLGASPRASLALFRACQARAALQSRAFVLPDDAKALAAPVLAHRLIVTPQSRLRGQDAEHIMAEVVAATPAPVEGTGPGGG
jgi:MoxR-like ATPase